jgi:CAAX protease family protein
VNCFDERDEAPLDGMEMSGDSRVEPATPAQLAMIEPGREASRGRIPPGRLTGWFALVGALAALSYTATIAGGDIPDDVLYQWSTAALALVQYAVILAIVLLISRGIPRAALGLRRPTSWPRALGLVVAAYVGIAVLTVLLNLVLKAGEEQGLVPKEWDSSHAAPFIANFAVVALVAPVVEELTYRGLGFAVTRDRWGAWPAIAITAVAFGLAHGLFVALPILTLFGVVLAFVRERTNSVYPTMLLHAIFNSVALIAAVTIGTGS